MTEQQQEKKTKNFGSQFPNKLYTYADVSKEINAIYLSTTTNNSNILDIIGMYVNGQKILYTESKTNCEQKLTYLMIPSILFTVISSIINLILDDDNGRIIASVLSALIAFILALINYLKLDARAEAHRVSAYKYDKLVSYISFQSGKQLFLANANKEMTTIITNIENAITEIKETNTFVLPEQIRYQLPKLSTINIFAKVKKLGNDEMIKKNNLTVIYAELAEEENKLTVATDFDAEGIKNNIKEILEKKKTITNEIIGLQNEYNTIDKDLNDELDEYLLIKRKRFFTAFDFFKV